MVRQAEAEEEVIQAGVMAAFGDGAPVVEVVVFGDEGAIERPRLPASEGADALMAALDEREEGFGSGLIRLGGMRLMRGCGAIPGMSRLLNRRYSR